MRLFAWCQIFFLLLSSLYKIWIKCGIKYGRIPVFTDQCSRVSGQNHRFCKYTGEYGLVKTHILVYFMLRMYRCVVIVNSYSHIWNTAIYNFDTVAVSKFLKFAF